MDALQRCVEHLRAWILSRHGTRVNQCPTGHHRAWHVTWGTRKVSAMASAASGRRRGVHRPGTAVPICQARQYPLPLQELPRQAQPCDGGMWCKHRQMIFIASPCPISPRESRRSCIWGSHAGSPVPQVDLQVLHLNQQERKAVSKVSVCRSLWTSLLQTWRVWAVSQSQQP